MRQRRSVVLKRLIREAAERNCGNTVRILDMGGEIGYWKTFGETFLRQNSVHLTLINLDYSRLSPRSLPDPTLYTVAGGDCCDLADHIDHSFEIVHSNSVIEHVGDWQRVLAFGRNVRRLAPAYFVQTPNFWFPIEPHFGAVGFQWLPEPVRVRMVNRRAMGQFPQVGVDRAHEFVQEVRLLTAWQMRHVFPDAQIVGERVFGFTKSFMAVRPGVPG
jgi:hypothetical protein